MAVPRPTKFSSYDFSNAELYAATRFDTLQLMLFQTLFAEAAEERLALTIDTSKPDEFIQREACLRGTMEAFDRLISLASEITAPEAKDAAKHVAGIPGN